MKLPSKGRAFLIIRGGAISILTTIMFMINIIIITLTNIIPSQLYYTIRQDSDTERCTAPRIGQMASKRAYPFDLIFSSFSGFGWQDVRH